MIQVILFGAQLTIDWDTCASGDGSRNMLPPIVTWAKPLSNGNAMTMTDALGVESVKMQPMCLGALPKVPVMCGMHCQAHHLPSAHHGMQVSLITSHHKWRHNAFTFSNFDKDEVNSATTSQSSIG